MITDINELAPYPHRADDQTADALARHLTLQTYRLVLDVDRLYQQWEAAGLPKTGPLRDAYVNTTSAISAQYGLVLYLRRETGEPSEEPLVAEVYQPYDGWYEHVEDDLREWLTGYGINPQDVIDWRDARAVAA